MGRFWSLTLFLAFAWTFGSSTGNFLIRLRADSPCPVPGYFRDETDCRKFYRCAEHPTEVLGQNYIIKAEFHCPDGTIFDEALSSCNHINFVHNIPEGCNISSPNAKDASTTTTPSATKGSTTIKATTSTTMKPNVVPPTEGLKMYPGGPPPYPQFPPHHPFQVVPVPVLPENQLSPISNVPEPSFIIPNPNVTLPGANPSSPGWMLPQQFPQSGPWVLPGEFPRFYSFPPPPFFHMPVGGGRLLM